mgnify:CR=1 FL=1
MKKFNERLTEEVMCEGEDVIATKYASEYGEIVIGLAIQKLYEYENLGTPEEFALLKTIKKITDLKEANNKLIKQCVNCDETDGQNLYKVTNYMCKSCLVGELNDFRDSLKNGNEKHDDKISLAYTLINVLKDEYPETSVFNEYLKIITDELNMKIE